MASMKGLYVSLGLVFAVFMGFILFLNLYIASGVKSKNQCRSSKTACNTELHSS